MRQILIIFIMAALTLGSGPAALGNPSVKSSRGQTVYVPAYSHIYIGNKETPYRLTITLSIRNIDPDRTITITQVDYYATQGKILKKMMDTPLQLAPLASTRYIIAQKDDTGGSGANFMVKWESESAACPPIIESIMIGTQSQQGISFTSRGEAVSNKN